MADVAKKNLEQFQQQLAKIIQAGYYKGSKKGATEHVRNTHIFSRATMANYQNVVRDFTQFVFAQHGITDINFLRQAHGEEFIQHQLERFSRDEIAAGTVKTYIHALSKLQNMARDQTGKRIRVINAEKALERANASGAIRHYEDADKGRIINREQAEQMIHSLVESRSHNAQVLSEYARFSMETGSRISAGLRLQVKDLNFERNTVTFHSDKGGKTRTVLIDPKYMSHLKTLVEGKSSGRQVFELRNRKGHLLKISTARKQAENLYARHASKLGLEGANYHSQRKAFANARYSEYKAMNYKALERDLARRMKDSPQLARKMQALESKSGARHGSGRHYSHQQLAKLLVSIDLGHERLDVLRFYLEKE